MNAHIDSIRNNFPSIQNTIYINTATQALGNQPAADALQSAVSQWCSGRFDWTQAERAGEENRAIFAQIIGADADEIALIPFVSAGAGIVAAQLPQAQPSENIVLAAGEFASNFLPWRLLTNKGYEIRLVPANNGITSAERYADFVDSSTRLVAASAVHAGNGYRVDLSILSELAQNNDAWLFVDACQAAGAIPIAVTGVDFLATASHKFLLGTRGTGYLYVRRGLIPEMTPILAGWKAAPDPLNSFFGPQVPLSQDASKLDTSLAWFNALADRASFEVIESVGVSAIVDRNAALVSYLYESLESHGIGFMAFPPRHRSTLVSVDLPRPDEAIERLRAAKVVASIRDGRVRLALHAYNHESEIDQVVAAIAAMDHT